MIEVEGLSKNFGRVRALDRVSFRVEEGTIAGFLGPNGAGKSTALRILSGYMPGDEGTVRVGGLDVRSRSLEVRGIVGYLPEAVPLYPEMRVSEYLRFRARLKGIPIYRRKLAISKAMELAGIEDVRRRVIGTLSRGYRQRVGLADALLGDPKVLILDEPTVGLDPEQVRQFRQLIRVLGGSRTILFSTHILSEVELVCSTVVIIHRGRVLAQGPVESVRKQIGSPERAIAEIAGLSEDIRAAFGREPGVRRVRVEPLGDSDEDPSGLSYHRVILEPEGDQDVRETVYRVARERGWSLRELRREVRSLEDVFVDVVRSEEEP